MVPADTKPTGPGGAAHPEPRITLEAAPQRVRVTLGGVTVADSADTLVLRETGYDPVYYFPRADVTAVLEKTQHTTYCPHKGNASYWTLRAGGKEAENAAWSYEAPHDAVAAIRGRLAFNPGGVDAIEPDGGAGG